MITAASLKDHVKGALSGLVDSLGEITPKSAFVRVPSGKAAVSLVREGYRTHVEPGPQLAKRVHVIEDAVSFAEWLKRHGDVQKVVEILIDEDKAVASLDPRSVDTCVVSMPLAFHPRFARWNSLFGRDLEQRDLHQHVLSCLEDFREIPLGDDDGTVNEGQLLAAQLQKFAAVRTSDVKVEVDDLGYVRFAAAAGKVEVTGKLPPKFKILVPMFLDVKDGSGVEISYELEMFLGVEPAEKGPPSFTLRCPKLAVVRRQARLDLVEHLRRLLAGTDFLVGLGKLSTATYIGQIESAS